jgi:predicted porin
MNKKVMALAVAGAFATPAVALAQASNVQIYGTAYVEYSYGHQGLKSTAGNGDLVNADVLQTPGSAIGFKGEEALGGGLSVWFQCESTAEFRGGGTQNTADVKFTASAGISLPTIVSFSKAAQNSGIFCGRNSAVGMKGSLGNIFIGNWDAPIKANSGGVRIVSETGAWGTQPMLFGGSSSFMDQAAGTTFSRRQNSTINYISPVWNGVQLSGIVSTVGAQIGATTNATTGKARMWGAGANYTNGPLLLTVNYERHNNFNTLAQPTTNSTADTNVSSTDWAWDIGGAYQFGPVRAGVLYTKQYWDQAQFGDASVSAWNIAGDWKITGPHEVLASYTKANSTSGNYAPLTGGGVTTIGVRTFNGGVGNTGGSMWTIEYQYWFSKRTRGSLGYTEVRNDAMARYNIGGYTSPAGGASQNAWISSLKTTF